MTIFKRETYSTATINVRTGDDEFDNANEGMLSVSLQELISALNAESLCDTVFRRIMKERTKKHNDMLDKIPGCKE